MHEMKAPAIPLMPAQIGPTTAQKAAIIVPMRAAQITKKSLKTSGMYLIRIF